MDLSKNFIIEYLRNYYTENKKSPISTDKTHPFSAKTVRNKFGTWSNLV